MPDPLFMYLDEGVRLWMPCTPEEAQRLQLHGFSVLRFDLKWMKRQRRIVNVTAFGRYKTPTPPWALPTKDTPTCETAAPKTSRGKSRRRRPSRLAKKKRGKTKPIS